MTLETRSQVAGDWWQKNCLDVLLRQANLSITVWHSKINEEKDRVCVYLVMRLSLSGIYTRSCPLFLRLRRCTWWQIEHYAIHTNRNELDRTHKNARARSICYPNTVCSKLSSVELCFRSHTIHFRFRKKNKTNKPNMHDFITIARIISSSNWNSFLCISRTVIDRIAKMKSFQTLSVEPSPNANSTTY